MKNNPMKLIEISEILDKNKLYSIADKIDRIAQNTSKNFDSIENAVEYIKKLGLPTFTQNMDKAADDGVTIKGISIKNDPEMQKLYKDSAQVAGGMTVMPSIPSPMPISPAPIPMPAATTPPMI